MKHLLTSIFAAISSLAMAQTTIVEEKFTATNKAVGYHFLPNANRIVIEKGFFDDSYFGKTIQSINSYDSEGFYEKLLDNVPLANCFFLPSENGLLLTKKMLKKSDPLEIKFLVDGKQTPYAKYDDELPYFTNDYKFGFLNDKKQSTINLQKDNLLLNRTFSATNFTKQIALKKPDIARIFTKENANYANNNGFGVRVNEYNFGLITKSITKDYKETTLFRTVYSYEGIQLLDVAYKIQLPENYLVYSNNGGGPIYTASQTQETILSDLAINNFVTSINDEVYIYGLFGNEAKSAANSTNAPAGFYVFKFDKTGTLLWKSLQTITDLDNFNKSQNIAAINLNFVVRNTDLVISIFSNQNKNAYLNFSTLDVLNGNKTNAKKITFTTITSKDKQKQFLDCNLKNTNYPNLCFDKEGLISAAINQKFLAYLATLKNTKEIFIKTFIGKQGLWVVESDNVGYYKVLFFED